MKPPLAIWQDLRLPQDVIEEAKFILHYPELRRTQGADVANLYVNGKRVEFVYADAYCPKHVDWDEVSLLWVARNDTDSWVAAKGVRQTKLLKRQPVGTIILLDINHEHMLNHRDGMGADSGVWAAAQIGWFHKWPSPEEVEDKIVYFLNQVKPKASAGEVVCPIKTC